MGLVKPNSRGITLLGLFVIMSSASPTPSEKRQFQSQSRCIASDELDTLTISVQIEIFDKTTIDGSPNCAQGLRDKVQACGDMHAFDPVCSFGPSDSQKGYNVTIDIGPRPNSDFGDLNLNWWQCFQDAIEEAENQSVPCVGSEPWPK